MTTANLCVLWWSHQLHNECKDLLNEVNASIHLDEYIMELNRDMVRQREIERKLVSKV